MSSSQYLNVRIFVFLRRQIPAMKSECEDEKEDEPIYIYIIESEDALFISSAEHSSKIITLFLAHIKCEVKYTERGKKNTRKNLNVHRISIGLS